MTEESKAVNIVKSLINLVGVTAGIIIASIGAIMFLNAVFNLYLFGIDTPKYNNYDYKCEAFDVDRIEARIMTGGDGRFAPMPVTDVKGASINQKITKLTEEQKEELRTKFSKCKEEVKVENTRDFYTKEKRSMATGLAFMIVGFPLVYFYQRRRKSKS